MLHSARQIDISLIDTKEKLFTQIAELCAHNDNELSKYLRGVGSTDPEDRRHAIHFLVDFITILKTRLERESLYNDKSYLDAIVAADKYSTDWMNNI